MSDTFIYLQAVFNNKVYKIKKKTSEGFVLIVISLLINILAIFSA